MVVPEHRTDGLAAVVTAAVVLVVGHGRAARIIGSGRPAPTTSSSFRRIAVVVVVVAFAVVFVVVAATATAAIVVVVVIFLVVVVTVTVPSVDAVVIVVVVVVVIVMVVTVVVMMLVVSANDGVSGRLTPAGRVVLDGGGHQGSGGPVTVEPGLQELVSGQEMVAGVHQTGRV